jgi:hypothetical protein
MGRSDFELELPSLDLSTFRPRAFDYGKAIACYVVIKRMFNSRFLPPKFTALEINSNPLAGAKFMQKMFFFVLAAVTLSLMVASQNAQAQSRSEIPTVEVGAQYTLLRINGFGPNDATDSGVGARLTYNISENLGVEGEVNFFPQGRINFANISSTLDSNRMQGLFGAKIGKRGERAGIFAKVRPGFMRFSEGTPSLGTASSETQFALDYGGVVELYPVRAFALRFDVGDTLIRYSNFANPFFTHNLQISTGVALRF